MATIHSSAYAILIDALIAGRKAAGMTQTDLADLWQKTQPVITRIENKERRLDTVEFLELCILLNLDPNAIITKAHNHLKKELFVRAGL